MDEVAVLGGGGTYTFAPPPRGRRLSASAVQAALQRSLTASRVVQAPWNATRWRPPPGTPHAEVDRRVGQARAMLDIYDAHAARPRRTPTASSDAADAALLARAHGVAQSTLAGDLADAALHAAATAHAARRRKTYEAWDARVYVPTVDELAEAVDARAAARARVGLRRYPRGGLGARGGGQEAAAAPPLVLRHAVPLTLRDPLKASRVKALEEGALTQPVGCADLHLPASRTRAMLPAAFWSEQALSSTPHGYHLKQRAPLGGEGPSLDHSRVYHDDYTPAHQLARGARGRVLALDAEWPRGKRISVSEHYRDTGSRVLGGAAAARTGDARVSN